MLEYVSQKGDIMQNLIYNNDKYSKIFEYKPDVLIKYSRLDVSSWKKLASKNLQYLNLPIEIAKLSNEEYSKFKYCKSKVYLPKLINYETLFNENYTKNLSTREILLLLRKNLLIIKYLHKNGVIHGDLFSHNIMINKDLDLCLIDFDASIIDNVISEENVYYEDLVLDKTKISLTRACDKTDILDLYMYYLIYGNFKKGEIERTDVTKLGLSNALEKEIMAYINHDIRPNYNCYFLSLVNELLKMGYESKVLEKRIVH